MTSDPGERERRRRRPSPKLPRILGVEARRTSFEPPPHRNFESSLPKSDAVEFVVETDGAIPIRALGPVLWIGDSAATEVRMVDETHYVFVSLRPDDLNKGAPILLGWSGEAERTETGFTFEAPK